FNYQYLKKRTEITAAIMEWLYEHSAGVVSVVVSLIHDAQEIAILTGTEELNLETLREAYQQRMNLLHDYIQPNIIQSRQTSTIKKKKPVDNLLKEQRNSEEKQCSIHEIVEQAQQQNIDVVLLLKEYYPVIEVVI
ncbi:MAG: hypothetical protein ACI4JN_08180, partial [Ruminococcus sp.]